MHRKPPNPLYQCCYSSLLNGRSKNGCFFFKASTICIFSASSPSLTSFDRPCHVIFCIGLALGSWLSFCSNTHVNVIIMHCGIGDCWCIWFCIRSKLFCNLLLSTAVKPARKQKHETKSCCENHHSQWRPCVRVELPISSFLKQAQGAQHRKHIGFLCHDATGIISTFNCSCWQIVHAKQTHETSKTGAWQPFGAYLGRIAWASHHWKFDLSWVYEPQPQDSAWQVPHSFNPLTLKNASSTRAVGHQMDDNMMTTLLPIIHATIPARSNPSEAPELQA